MAPVPQGSPDAVTLRPATDDDLDFLARVYASTREEELAPLPWTPEQKAAFLAQQFAAQHRHYHLHYPHADFDLVLVDGKPGGRLYVDRRPGEVRLMDIALLPHVRGRGIGTEILRGLLAEAAGRGDRVTAHVERENPAMRLYRGLGFEAVEEVGVYVLMEWRPAQAKTAS